MWGFHLYGQFYMFLNVGIHKYDICMVEWLFLYTCLNPMFSVFNFLNFFFFPLNFFYTCRNAFLLLRWKGLNRTDGMKNKCKDCSTDIHPNNIISPLSYMPVIFIMLFVKSLLFICVYPRRLLGSERFWSVWDLQVRFWSHRWNEYRGV